jgi:hypothetical protein
MTNLALTDRDLLPSLAAVDALDALACDDAFAAFCDERSDDAREHQDAALTAAEVSL